MFENVSLVSPDPIFGLTAAFNADPRSNKVNLSVGYYRSEDLKTPLMAVVKRAEIEVVSKEKLAQYLPIQGDSSYIQHVGELVFGKALWGTSSARIASFQSVGGTGALCVGGEFLQQEKVGDTIYLPDPTWANHKNIFGHLGLQVEYYPYYCAKENGINFEKTYAFLSKLKSHSIVLLHACCHNPTGVDFSMEEWKRLSELFLSKKLFPFFDFAYQGFGKGIEEDAEPVRLFAKEGHEMIVAVSLSKNFSLYCERVGALFIIGETHKTAERIQSCVRKIIRAIYSNPPFHGAQVVSHILGTPALKQEWERELMTMRERISEMRNALTKALVAKCKKKDLNFLNKGSGFFCYSGLSQSLVERLTKEHGIYMTSDGRINLAGLNWDNVDYVASAIGHETN